MILSRLQIAKGAIPFITFVAVAACSSAPKKTTPELSQYEGKKVALVEVRGEATAKSVVEVALINQLVKRGTFILISQQDVDTARSAPDQNPLDLTGLAKRAGADLALKAQVLSFSAETREGYSQETVRDSQLAAEQGGDGTTSRVYKVKSLTGEVRVELEFTPVTPALLEELGGVRKGIAEAKDQVQADAKSEAIHLPPKLRFLEKITNEAFQKFFEQYR